MPTFFVSNETVLSMNTDRDAAILSVNKEFKIQTALIRAIIQKESQGNICAYRVDYSVLKNQKWYLKTLTAEQKKYKNCYASYGLMQVLFGLARSYGFKGAPVELLNADVNVYYGCRHIQYLMKRYNGRLLDVIHAYNWGSNAFMDYNHDGIKDPGEPYKNQEYVDAVYSNFIKYGGKY